LYAATLHDDECQSVRINSTRSMRSHCPSRGVLTYINGMQHVARFLPEDEPCRDFGLS